MIIEINSVKKIYRNRCVLNIPSLTLDQPVIYGVVGENGAGKSTFLKLIAGLEPVSQGEISYNGKPLSAETIKQITYVSQSPYLLKRSVYDNIIYPLRLRQVPENEAHTRVEKMMAMLQIESLRDRGAHRLSAGETQKVALARALVFEPEVLLLDEPTANIDSDTIALIERVLKDRKGMMTMHISHNRDQVKRLCDEVLHLSKGELLTTEY
jgi:tungstate transport system ATP-binding protein